MSHMLHARNVISFLWLFLSLGHHRASCGPLTKCMASMTKQLFVYFPCPPMEHELEEDRDFVFFISEFPKPGR